MESIRAGGTGGKESDMYMGNQGHQCHTAIDVRSLGNITQARELYGRVQEILFQL